MPFRETVVPLLKNCEENMKFATRKNDSSLVSNVLQQFVNYAFDENNLMKSHSPPSPIGGA